MAAEDRPPTDRDWHTEALPATPQRDYLISSRRWLEAPQYLHELGEDFGVGLVTYKRRIGRYLLWRAGPAVGSDARYCAVLASDIAVHFELRLQSDKRASGVGPDGVIHDRFRTWKQALLADEN